MNPPYQLPVTVPNADKINPILIQAQLMQMPALYNQAIQAYPGDPLAATVLKGTTIEYDDASQVQRLIHQDASVTGLPDNIQAILDANKGPMEPWNFSNHQWGLGGGAFDSSLQVVRVMLTGTAQVADGIVIPHRTLSI